MARITKNEREEHIEGLRKLLPRGTTVYCIVRHVSASGMSRDISLVYFNGDPNGEHSTDRHPSYRAAKVLGWPYSEKHGRVAIRVSGCGMDMCFYTVSTLSKIIHGDGTALRYRQL